MTGLSLRFWPGGPATMVLLHSGVTDQRSWYDVAPLLTGHASVWTYDRPGHGESPVDAQGDLAGLLERIGPAWLVGNSRGGALALDAALARPERVDGLVLVSSAVTGAPTPVLDEDETRLDALMDAADREELLRLEAWFWLDGPGQAEGRVGGAARALMLQMNRGITEVDDDSDTDAWSRLPELRLPVTVACGALDAPYQVTRALALADRIPGARHVVLPGVAHLPALENPKAVAELILESVSG